MACRQDVTVKEEKSAEGKAERPQSNQSVPITINQAQR